MRHPTQFPHILFVVLALFAISACDNTPSTAHYDTASEATPHTQQANHSNTAALSFDNTADFQNAQKGFIATIPNLIVSSDLNDHAWNHPAYNFIEGEAPATVNKSLWRQASLNNINGLFKVTDGIYQVRGFDLANISFIEGESGWIVVDPLTSRETASKAMQLINQELGKKPVKAIIFTHSHIDHFGGVMGVLPNEHSIKNIQVIAPEGFMEEATSENIIAGVAMGRRADFMYGRRLPRSPKGHIDSGLGKEPAYGRFDILAPTTSINTSGESTIIDGVEFVFHMVSGSEAPAEFTFFLPEHNAFCGAELVSHTLHNLYTLRGAKVRDGLRWSNYIHQMINNMKGTDIYFASHHWPIWGNQNITLFLKQQRDIYKYIHDQSVRFLNQGLTPAEIAEKITLPNGLKSSFAIRGYYGTLKHNAKAVFQAYLGWYDGNPANLNPLPDKVSAPKYIQLMGGSENVLTQAQKAYDNGEYRWVAQLLNHLVFAEPTHQHAKELLAKAYDQLGYQAESAPWRDSYLTAAVELRHGAPSKGLNLSSFAGVLKHTPLENFLNSMATRLKAEDTEDELLSINLNITDLNENYVLTIENAVLHHEARKKDQTANATLNISHSLFLKVAIGEANISDLLFSDELSLEGSKLDLIAFFSLLEKPSATFNIVTP